MQLQSDLTPEQWEDTKRYFDNRCAYCGQESGIEQDHFIPLRSGGGLTFGNIVPACRSCNSSKGNRPFDEWYPVYKHYSVTRERRIQAFVNGAKTNEKEERHEQQN